MDFVILVKLGSLTSFTGGFFLSKSSGSKQPQSFYSLSAAVVMAQCNRIRQSKRSFQPCFPKACID